MTALPRVIPQDWLRHPFVARLARYADLDSIDIGALWSLIEGDMTIKKRRDLVVDGCEYRRLCFVEEGFAARYKLLRNGRRQIVNVVVPGDVVGMPGSFLDRSAYSVVAITDIKLQPHAIQRSTSFTVLSLANPNGFSPSYVLPASPPTARLQDGGAKLRRDNERRPGDLSGGFCRCPMQYRHT